MLGNFKEISGTYQIYYSSLWFKTNHVLEPLLLYHYKILFLSHLGAVILSKKKNTLRGLASLWLTVMVTLHILCSHLSGQVMG